MNKGIRLLTASISACAVLMTAACGGVSNIRGSGGLFGGVEGESTTSVAAADETTGGEETGSNLFSFGKETSGTSEASSAETKEKESTKETTAASKETTAKETTVKETTTAAAKETTTVETTTAKDLYAEYMVSCGLSDIVCYPLNGMEIYESKGKSFSTAQYAGKNDECTILQVYEDGWVKISVDGVTAYCYLSDFIDYDLKDTMRKSVTKGDEDVYWHSDLSDYYGWVSSEDYCYVMDTVGSSAQVLYSLDAGGWKMGWIPADRVN